MKQLFLRWVKPAHAALAGRGLLSLFVLTLWGQAAPEGAIASSDHLSKKASEPIRPPIECPTTLEELAPLLLRDLPSYANRVSQRAYDRHRTADLPGYILLAGRPEYEPLPLESQEYTPVEADATSQLFFTTLDRQSVAGESVRLQHYHWLFLTQTSSGWHLVVMFSTLGDDPADEPPTPPRDSSQGVIAQAIRLWLRDCRAGSIEPP